MVFGFEVAEVGEEYLFDVPEFVRLREAAVAGGFAVELHDLCGVGIEDYDGYCEVEVLEILADSEELF